MTASMPTRAATASAAAVVVAGEQNRLQPALVQGGDGSAAESLTASEIATAAHGSPSTSTKTTVSPRVSSADRRAASSTGDSHMDGAIQDGLPTRTARPATVPVTPRPANARKSVDAVAGSGDAPPQSRSSTACSEADSTAAASARTFSPVSRPSAATTALTVSRPVVKVPVLSKTTVSTARVASRDRCPLKEIPT